MRYQITLSGPRDADFRRLERILRHLTESDAEWDNPRPDVELLLANPIEPLPA